MPADWWEATGPWSPTMCQLPRKRAPGNEILGDLDGFTIGQQRTEQLVLGLARASELAAHLFPERSEAVSLATSRRTGRRKIGMCGQEPSACLECAQSLATAGIDCLLPTLESQQYPAGDCSTPVGSGREDPGLRRPDMGSSGQRGVRTWKRQTSDLKASTKSLRRRKGVVRPARFERATSWFVARRSIQLS